MTSIKLAFCFASVLGACTAVPVAAQTPLKSQLVTAGFTQPVGLEWAPDDRLRMFVVERRGVVWIVHDGVRLPTPFLDIRERVLSSYIEQGLLGIAFHPRYRQLRDRPLFERYLPSQEAHDADWVYVNYTRKIDGATVLVRYRVTPDGHAVDYRSRRVLVGPTAQPNRNHNGGQVAFGPDGKLYLALGDGGFGGCASQDGNQLLGKMLRLEADGSIPSDNPFVGNPAFRDEIWSYGLRNPWRFSFDRLTGDLYIGDVGRKDREEIDFQPASSAGGENYGWEVMEGTVCNPNSSCPVRVPSAPPCNDPSLVMPLHEYPHPVGDCGSVIGGFVYRGAAVPDLVGTYFFADSCNGSIGSLRYDGVAVSDLQDRTAELANNGAVTSVTSFGQDPDGELYMADLDGQIWKIVPQ